MGVVDQRTSVEIGIKISIQIIKVTLAILTVEVALCTYVLANYTVNWIFYSICFLTSLSLFASIYKAGKALNTARVKGFTGEWSLDHTKADFNSQALFCMLGTIMLFTVFLTPREKKVDSTSKALNELKTEISKISSSQSELDALDSKILQLEHAIREIQKTPGAHGNDGPKEE